MTFTDPSFLPWLWGLAAVPLLYLTRRRSRRVRLPHVFLWERVLDEDLPSRRRRLRDVLGVLLQVMIGALLILVCAGPQRTAQRKLPRPITIAVDISHAMTARTGDGRSRLDDARALIAGRLDELLAEGPVEVVECAAAAWPRTGLTEDKTAIAKALSELRTRPARLDPQVVMPWLAKRRSAGHRVLFFTAGVFDAEAGVAVGVEATVLRESEPNAGFTILEVNRAAASGRISARAVLESPGARSSGRLVLARDTVVLDERDIVIESDRPLVVEIEISSPVGWCTWRFVPATADAIASDDVVVFRHDPIPRVRVLLAGPAVDVHLRQALKALDHVVDVEKTSVLREGDWRSVEGFDLIILAGLDEKRALPPGRYLLLDSYAPALPMRRGGKAREVVVERQGLPDRLLRGIDLRDLDIDTAEKISLREGARPVLRGSCGALVSAGVQNDVSFVHVAFDPRPRNSSLALLAAYPLLVKDSIEELLERPVRRFPAAVAAGQEIVPEAPVPLDDSVFVTFDDEVEPVRLDTSGIAGLVTMPNRSGRARFRVAGTDELVGINVIHPTLVDVRTRWQGTTATVTGPGPQDTESSEPMSWMFLAAALILLLIEWWLFQVRWTT